LHTN